MSRNESNTYLGIILGLVRKCFSSPDWHLYKQYVLDILQESTCASDSARALVKLTENRPEVVFLHNDIALETYSTRTPGLPVLDIRQDVVDKYIHMFRTYIGPIALPLKHAMNSDDVGEEHAELSRGEAIDFLCNETMPTTEAEAAMAGLLNAMYTLSL